MHSYQSDINNNNYAVSYVPMQLEETHITSTTSATRQSLFPLRDIEDSIRETDNKIASIFAQSSLSLSLLNQFKEAISFNLKVRNYFPTTYQALLIQSEEFDLL